MVCFASHQVENWSTWPSHRPYFWPAAKRHGLLPIRQSSQPSHRLSGQSGEAGEGLGGPPHSPASRGRLPAMGHKPMYSSGRHVNAIQGYFALPRPSLELLVPVSATGRNPVYVRGGKTGAGSDIWVADGGGSPPSGQGLVWGGG